MRTYKPVPRRQIICSTCEMQFVAANKRRRFCSEKCRQRFKFRSGQPRKMSQCIGRRGTSLEYFEAKVTRLTGGCGQWTGAFAAAYGNFRHDGHTRAHRWSFEHFREPIDEGLVLDHLCRHSWCVNPWHLEQVTPTENRRRQTEANRVAA